METRALLILTAAYVLPLYSSGAISSPHSAVASSCRSPPPLSASRSGSYLIPRIDSIHSLTFGCVEDSLVRLRRLVELDIAVDGVVLPDLVPDGDVAHLLPQLVGRALNPRRINAAKYFFSTLAGCRGYEFAPDARHKLAFPDALVSLHGFRCKAVLGERRMDFRRPQLAVGDARIASDRSDALHSEVQFGIVAGSGEHLRSALSRSVDPPDAVFAFADVLDRAKARARHDTIHLAFRFSVGYFSEPRARVAALLCAGLYCSLLFVCFKQR